MQVASPPAKPLMIYDGKCNFCKFWITRWQQATEGKVEYIASQDASVSARFPELPHERFEGSVQFIETDGRVFEGAEAVFRSLTYTRFHRWPFWLYENVPGVKPVTEWSYHFVAQHREEFSALTRLLWGKEGALPEYSRVSSLFLRLLGFIYLCAFVSLGIQISGLMGSHGILPAAEWLDGLRQNAPGVEKYHVLPTVCWFGASDGFLHFLCWGGAGLGLLLMVGIAPAFCLLLMWIDYLSLCVVGRDFLSFQWDILLLETGFLAIFLAPLRFRLRWREGRGPSKVALWLLRWLLFRLMLESGLVKLLSGDPSWRHFTALDVHYETQPLPTWIGWYAHQLPAAVQHVCVVLMFIIELGVPFLIFAPRRLRFAGCYLLILLQVVIFLTGNYCFFNLLTIALCLLLLDDAKLGSWLRRAGFRRKKQGDTKTPEEPIAPAMKTLQEFEVPAAPEPRKLPDWPRWITAPLALAILLITGTQLAGMRQVRWEIAGPLYTLEKWIGPFRTVNTYGLFAVMTTTRMEIVVEGSNDGKTWLAYEFKYKPGDPKGRPRFVAPHQPRLDWQMWFAALGTYRENPWFVYFCGRLLQGSPDVLRLLERNPFPDAPPRFIRAVVYDYRFSNFQQRRAEGIWWRRELEGDYLPGMSLREK